MNTKKLYITPSIEEISIELSGIIAVSGEGGSDTPSPTDAVYIRFDSEIQEEGFGD